MDVPLVIKKNPYREQIDEMLIEGKSYTEIEKWLKANDAGVARQTISKYHKFCFNVNAEAAEIYNDEASKAKLQGEAQKQVDIIRFYDKIINSAEEADLSIVDPQRRVDLALRAAKQREEFLKEHGDKIEEERIQVLKDIRELLLSREVRESLAGLKSRRSFDDTPAD